VLSIPNDSADRPLQNFAFRASAASNSCAVCPGGWLGSTNVPAVHHGVPRGGAPVVAQPQIAAPRQREIDMVRIGTR